MFLRILQISQENSTEFACEICEIFKNTFFKRTALVAASVEIIEDFLEPYEISMMEFFSGNN